MVPVASVITGITFPFTFHMRGISIIRSLYFKIFSASFLITFLSLRIATAVVVVVIIIIIIVVLVVVSSSSRSSRAYCVGG